MAETNIPAAQPAPEGQVSNNVGAEGVPAQAETNDISSKFAHLAQKEKAFRAAQRKHQAEIQAWQAQRDAERAQVEAEIYGRIDKDPLGYLSQRGITQDQLTSLLINQQNPEANTVFQLQQENKELRQAIDKINKRFEENGKAAVDGALHQIGYEATNLISANKNDFEMLGLAGDDGIEAIKALCKLYWDEDKVQLSVRDAAEMVEQEYLENAMKLAQSQKVKTKLTPQEVAEQAQSQEALKTPQGPLKPQQTVKTLNSQATQKISGPTTDRVQRAKLRAAGIDPDTGQKIGA